MKHNNLTHRVLIARFIEFRTIKYWPFFIAWLNIGSVAMIFSELNKSEVSFNYQENRLKDMLTFIFFRSLAWRLCYFTIHDPSIHGSTMHNSCKNHPKMLKLYWENYVNICPQHHIESDGVFMNLLAFKYMVNIMNHYSLFSSNSSGTSHNKPKVNLEKAVP